MSKNRTVVQQKTRFVRAQSRILSGGFQPLGTVGEIARNGEIQESVLREVLLKVNRDLKRHSRMVHSQQAINSVVEQIDDLYWTAGAASLDQYSETATDAGGDDSSTLYQGDDLTLDKNISKFPPTWDTSADSEDEEEGISQDDYITAVIRLQDLSPNVSHATKAQHLPDSSITSGTISQPAGERPTKYSHPKRNARSRAHEDADARNSSLRKSNEKFGDVQVPATAGEDDSSDVEMRDDDGKAKLKQILAGW